MPTGRPPAEGMVGAVPADGSEPEPVFPDIGSGSPMHRTTEWWAYDGMLSRPRADTARGSCSCGWRGANLYPIDWTQQDGDGFRDLDTSGPRDDRAQHIADVESRSVPLPSEVEDLLHRLEDQLDALAAGAPLAALKAVAALERLVGRIGREAASAVESDEPSWETIGRALGLTAKEARSRLTRVSLRR
ncbi:hypothetical protein [Streptomyces gilvosporeus]|uniref:Uncharacterized protein n=1 Tax=Streptomyces gilvosporeus TaxID=553510 RepID=A0A1V0U1U6_9ACTN|nr:hypothetical protein [Streptomyces gilvosporeus]ARF59117.1 hypothetical protein B1H19_37465 [Streptomyces gilvosporeus]